MTNRQIADKLREMAAYCEMEGVQFKPAAYERAADSIEGHPAELADIYAQDGRRGFRAVTGVGVGIADHVERLLKTGDFPERAKFRKKYPVDLAALGAIEDLGPKRIRFLYEKLKIRTVAELEKAVVAGKIRRLPGFGEKSEDNLLRGIARVKRSVGRRLLGDVLPLAVKFERELRRVSGVDQAFAAGSVRRRQETVGDLDILVTANQPEKVMDRFAAFPEVAEVIERGQTKIAVRLTDGLQADVRVIPDISFGSALQYFTGSKDHNILVRKLAIEKGLKLNEYGIWKGRRRIASRTEADVYRALGLPYIEPELRTASGEIEAAQADRLPNLIAYNAVRGDLQVQTDWTDGDASITANVEAARHLGLEYLAVTDHTQALAMVGGLNEKKLAAQGKAIDKLNATLAQKMTGFRVLKGTECDILKDGSLDLDDAALARLDFVGVSIHSHFRLPRAEQTARVIRAMENPHVDAIFHPTGRVLGRRDPYELDMEAIIRAAKRTNTALEIDAFPDRLDLNDAHVRLAVRAGVKLVIDTDAHRTEHLTYLEYGVAVARRGWASKKDVLNARPLKDLLKWLQTPKPRRR